MSNEKSTKTKSEEDFDKIEFAGCFSNILNLVALGLILVIFAILYDAHYSKAEIKNETINKAKLELNLTGNSKIDIEKFNILMNEKLKEFENIQKESEKIRNENMKYYGTLFSLILSVVGFFGFKSIHDTRQSAIEVVKNKAEEVAKKITESKVEDYAKQNTHLIVDKYLKNEGNLIIENHSKATAKTIAYDQAESIARATASEEFSRLRTNYDEAKNALREDLNIIERDRKMLLKRIQDLEELAFGNPNLEDLNDNEVDDNPQTVL